MAKYRRFGYVVHRIGKSKKGEIVDATNVGFHHNPQKANEEVDLMIQICTATENPAKIVSDETFNPNSHLQGAAIRRVLIEYPSGASTVELTIERWYVVVGRE